MARVGTVCVEVEAELRAPGGPGSAVPLTPPVGRMGVALTPPHPVRAAGACCAVGAATPAPSRHLSGRPETAAPCGERRAAEMMKFPAGSAGGRGQAQAGPPARFRFPLNSALVQGDFQED